MVSGVGVQDDFADVVAAGEFFLGSGGFFEGEGRCDGGSDVALAGQVHEEVEVGGVCMEEPISWMLWR